MGPGLWFICDLLPIVMQPTPNEVSVIPDGIVKIGEPDMEPLGTEAQQTEEAAAQPGKPVHRRVYYQWIAKDGEDAFCEHIGDAECGQQFWDDWNHNLTQHPESPQAWEAILS